MAPGAGVPPASDGGAAVPVSVGAEVLADPAAVASPEVSVALLQPPITTEARASVTVNLRAVRICDHPFHVSRQVQVWSQAQI